MKNGVMIERRHWESPDLEEKIDSSTMWDIAQDEIFDQAVVSMGLDEDVNLVIDWDKTTCDGHPYSESEDHRNTSPKLLEMMSKPMKI